MSKGTVERVRDFCEIYLRLAFTPLARLLAWAGVTPNQISVTGFAVTLIAAALLLSGFQFAAGLVFLLASSCDLLDGTVARLENRATSFGAFLDSSLDRLAEGAMFMAIAYRFAADGEAVAAAVVTLALLGAMLTSYTRARAESLGLSCKVGWLSRAERVLLITAGLVFDILPLAIYLLAVLALWTSSQRITHVYRGLRERESNA